MNDLESIFYTSAKHLFVIVEQILTGALLYCSCNKCSDNNKRASAINTSNLSMK